MNNLHNWSSYLTTLFFDHDNPWLHLIVHIILVIAPATLLCITIYKIRSIIIKPLANSLTSSPERFEGNKIPRKLKLFIKKYTLVHQLRLSLMALLTIPITYGLLELPKTIINSAIDNDNYIINSSPFGLPQIQYLLILCALYLVLLFFNGALKFVLNWYKGCVSEELIKRLRLYIFAIQRKKQTNQPTINMAPVLLQEVEPICAFSGDSFVVPLLQGGTALTVIVFMMMQSVVLGAAVMTLIPVQLIVVPIFQRKINLLVKKRLLEVRSLNTMIAQEDKQYTNKGQKSIRYSFNRLHKLRIKLFKTKYLMKSINNFIMNLTPFFFYTVGGYLVIEGKLSLGALVASLASYKDLSSTIRELFIYYQTLQDARTRYIEMVKHIF